jgi:hypothetical protein
LGPTHQISAANDLIVEHDPKDALCLWAEDGREGWHGAALL